MGVHLDDELVDEIDRRVGHERRNAYIADAVRRQLEAERWAKIRSAFGSISDEGHPWDPDVAKWVHDSRHEDPRRVG
ncbi:MAG TPA: ribbon-helix-helix domain-containing protein [Actinomycetota bacterium]|jgi:metal-responsive CopG/Arc/MetJ family transcriptional regulator|nr:ribbon-helix-helix domain-containing protein [Actinomycetota bacterium]